MRLKFDVKCFLDEAHFDGFNSKRLAELGLTKFGQQDVAIWFQGAGGPATRKLKSVDSPLVFACMLRTLAIVQGSVSVAIPEVVWKWACAAYLDETFGVDEIHNEKSSSRL